MNQMLELPVKDRSKEVKNARQVSSSSPWSYLHFINLQPEVIFFSLFFFYTAVLDVCKATGRFRGKRQDLS